MWGGLHGSFNLMSRGVDRTSGGGGDAGVGGGGGGRARSLSGVGTDSGLGTGSGAGRAGVDGSVERVLIIRPSALGDVCRSVPVLVSVRRAWPSARIDWLVQDTFAEAVCAHPDLSGVIPFDRRGLRGWWRSVGGAARTAEFFRTLRRGGYDVVIDAQGLARSAVFSAFTGARTRVGARRSAELSWLSANVRADVPREMHTVDRMLGLVEAIGVEAVRDLRLYSPESSVASLVEKFPWVVEEPFAVVAPTSRWVGKAWPAERYAAVSEALLDLREGGRAVVERVAVVGSGGERGQCGAVLALAEKRPGRVVDLLGKTGIGELMGLIERSRLVVANDSAALHMAVGFGRPYVGLFGPTRVSLVGPYLNAERPMGRGVVLQHVSEGDVLDHKDAEGGLKLMERIGVDEVVSACAGVVGG